LTRDKDTVYFDVYNTQIIADSTQKFYKQWSHRKIFEGSSAKIGQNLVVLTPLSLFIYSPKNKIFVVEHKLADKKSYPMENPYVLDQSILFFRQQWIYFLRNDKKLATISKKAVTFNKTQSKFNMIYEPEQSPVFLDDKHWIGIAGEKTMRKPSIHLFSDHKNLYLKFILDEAPTTKHHSILNLMVRWKNRFYKDKHNRNFDIVWDFDRWNHAILRSEFSYKIHSWKKTDKNDRLCAFVRISIKSDKANSSHSKLHFSMDIKNLKGDQILGNYRFGGLYSPGLPTTVFSGIL